MFEYFAVLRVAASSAADPASRAAAATYESANDLLLLLSVEVCAAKHVDGASVGDRVEEQLRVVRFCSPIKIRRRSIGVYGKRRTNNRVDGATGGQGTAGTRPRLGADRPAGRKYRPATDVDDLPAH